MLHFGNGWPMHQLHDYRKRCVRGPKNSYP
jgi:hypothetical protein